MRAGSTRWWRPGPFAYMARHAVAVSVAALVLAAFPPPTASAQDSWDEEEDEDDSRSFLYRELVLSVLYSRAGVVGLPPDDPGEDHVELSPRPPGNYVGLDYVRTFDASRKRGRLSRWLPLTAINLHPRILLDMMERSDTFDRVKFAPQDLWLRFNPGRADRYMIHVGQFVLPYGVNPLLAPRQRFLLPLEALDLGLKWDWGVNLKGPLGDYDWEIASTIGSGETLHLDHLLDGSEETSALATGRLGTPTYWDLQYGLSFLYGDLPVIRAAKHMSDISISRWRVAVDTMWKNGTYLMAGGQLSYGQDGFAGDRFAVMITGGETADVLGYRAWFDWVVPGHLDFRVGAQLESVIRDLSTSESDDTAAIVELGYSLNTAITFMLDFRHEFHRTMGDDADELFFTFVYYGR